MTIPDVATNDSWFSAGLVPNPADDRELLIVRYWFDWNPTGNNQTPQVKFPGGSRKYEVDKTPEQTLVREFDEEVFAGGGRIKSSLLHSETSRSRNGSSHTKYFFLVVSHNGQLRQDDLFEHERGTATDPNGTIRIERVTAPVFVNIRTLAEQIFHRHALALRAYCGSLITTREDTVDVRETARLLDLRLDRGARR